MDQHLLEIYQILSEVYEKDNKADKALEYSRKYINLRDKIDKNLHKLFLNEKKQTLNRMQEEINSIKEKEEKKIIKLELQYKKRELISKKLHSLSNRDFLEELNQSLQKLSKKDDSLKKIIKNCQSHIESSLTWSDFLNTYEQAEPEFIRSLRNLSDKLSATEIRCCTLIHLGLDNYEIARFMSVSKRSIEQHRYRIKKKLSLEKNLTEYLLSLC